MKPRILVLLCGGTIVMAKTEGKGLVTLSPENALPAISSLEPRVHEWADISVEFICNIDSTNITPNHWEKLGKAIVKDYNAYDGFVVTHGTDTMAYTASALAFSLKGLKKPVVFTGAQIPGSYLESDARRNFVNALRLAMMDVAGVFIVFAEKILLGVRATKISNVELRAFKSVNQTEIGSIRTKIVIDPDCPKKGEGSVAWKGGFESNIAVISIVPGMSAHFFEQMLDSKPKGVVLVAYGSGNIPSQFLPFLEKARHREIPVIVRSQCLEGSTQMKTYATGAIALEYNVIEAFDMSLEATIVKLMWILDKQSSYHEIKKMIHTNYVGEINTL